MNVVSGLELHYSNYRRFLVDIGLEAGKLDATSLMEESRWPNLHFTQLSAGVLLDLALTRDSHHQHHNVRAVRGIAAIKYIQR